MTSAPAFPPQISNARRRVRDITLYGCGGISAMSIAAVAPSLPEMSQHFADVPDIDLLARLVVSIPTLLLALAGPVVGTVADRLGRKPLMVFALVLYAAAGVLPVLLNDLHAILGSRIALGLAMGILFTLAPTLLADYYEDIPARRKAVATYAASTAAGGVLFVLLGGFMADLHWRGPCALYLVGLAFLPTLIATITEPQMQNAGTDISTGAPAPIRTP